MGNLKGDIERYMSLPGNQCGGNCHIVLSDYNLDNDSLAFCRGYCSANGDEEGYSLMLRLSNLNIGDRADAVGGGDKDNYYECEDCGAYVSVCLEMERVKFLHNK